MSLLSFVELAVLFPVSRETDGVVSSVGLSGHFVAASYILCSAELQGPR